MALQNGYSINSSPLDESGETTPLLKKEVLDVDDSGVLTCFGCSFAPSALSSVDVLEVLHYVMTTFLESNEVISSVLSVWGIDVSGSLSEHLTYVEVRIRPYDFAYYIITNSVLVKYVI